MPEINEQINIEVRIKTTISDLLLKVNYLATYSGPHSGLSIC